MVSRLDAYGVVLLALYFAIEFNRDELAEHFARGHAAAIASYTALAGAFFGRGIGMSRRTIALLKRVKNTPVA